MFYLPARGAFEQAIDDVIAAALKEEKAGFMERMAVKSVMLVVKPMIKKAIEAMRRGLMFSAVVDVRSDFHGDDLSALTNTYIEALTSDKKNSSLPEHARVVQAVRAEIQALQAVAKGKPAEAAPVMEGDAPAEKSGAGNPG